MATVHGSPNPYLSVISAAATKNDSVFTQKSTTPTLKDQPLTYERACHIINMSLSKLSPPDASEIVYISEGANTMDISRAAFELSHPRQRLDAGTYATMGVGGGYAIAAHAAYNYPETTKRIICLFGDSAFGFSGMEIETMARHRMPVLIFVMNNSGIYHGDSLSEEEWRGKQAETVTGRTEAQKKGERRGMRSTSLLWETRYEMMAEMVGGKGWFVRTEEELAEATRDGWLWGERERNVVLINVVIEAGLGKSISFAWEMSKKGVKVEEALKGAKL
jgi:2-hydroxyacyl-CoA lyase 1